MIKQLKDNNYLFVDNFITTDKANKMYKQFQDDAKNFPESFVKDEQCPKSLAIYNYRWVLGLLAEKVAFMNKAVGEHLLPTYAYSRIYAKGEVLKKHKDRPACEVSVTLNLGGDKDWDIYFTKPNGEVVSQNLKPGQAVIYLGMQSEHWRDAYKGKHYGQVFLHYVKLNGEYWNHCFDKAR
jgi:hypothetical protein